MCERLTNEQIEAIRKRAEAATEGPWVWREGKGNEMMSLHGEYKVMDFGNNATYYPIEGDEPCDEDADFIAHAREDVPALLVEIERLRGVIKDIRECSDIETAVIELTNEALGGDSE